MHHRKLYTVRGRRVPGTAQPGQVYRTIHVKSHEFAGGAAAICLLLGLLARYVRSAVRTRPRAAS